MKIVTDFYNKTCTALMGQYFPMVKYHRDNKNSQKMAYAIELFNNGCLTYNRLLELVAKEVKDTKENVDKIISNFIQE